MDNWMLAVCLFPAGKKPNDEENTYLNTLIPDHKRMHSLPMTAGGKPGPYTENK